MGSRRPRSALQWRLQCKRDELLQGVRVEGLQDVMDALEVVFLSDAHDALAVLLRVPLLGIAELVAAADATTLPLLGSLRGETRLAADVAGVVCLQVRRTSVR